MLDLVVGDDVRLKKDGRWGRVTDIKNNVYLIKYATWFTNGKAYWQDKLFTRDELDKLPYCKKRVWENQRRIR